MRIALIVGTRPEAIKLMPVFAALAATPGVDVRLLSTGQHRDLLDGVYALFGVRPDVDLRVMTPNQTLAGLTARLTEALGAHFAEHAYDAVVVQGDTTSAMVGALTAFYTGVPVAHVEAGLRTRDIRSPFPEELNRRIASLVTRWHFAPTELAADNLAREGVRDGVQVVGNTVVDAALHVAGLPQAAAAREALIPGLGAGGRRHVLVTAHRRENFGAGITSIAAALCTLAERWRELDFVFPVHPNPNVRGVVHARLGALPNVRLVEPLPYDALLAVLRDAHLVLTDSGGLQEEAPAFDVPVLVLRASTERPEGVTAGCSRVVGTDADAITGAFDRLMTDADAHAAMARAPNPYGDGLASARIARALTER